MRKIDETILEDVIFNDVGEYSKSIDVNDYDDMEKLHNNKLHIALINDLYSELSKCIDVLDVIDMLREKGAFLNIKVEDSDIKKIAIDELAIDTVKLKPQHKVFSGYKEENLVNIMQHIEDEEFYEILFRLVPQLKEIIDIPLENHIRNVVKSALVNGKVFDKLIKDDKDEMMNDNDSDFVNYCERNISIYEKYGEGAPLNDLIDSIVFKFKNSKIYDDLLRKTTEEDFIDFILDMNDLENYYCNIQFKALNRALLKKKGK